MKSIPNLSTWKIIIWACFLIKLTLDCGVIFFAREWGFLEFYEGSILFFWSIAALCMGLAVTKSNHRMKDRLIEMTGHLVLGFLAVWAFFSFTYFLFGNHLLH